jgi:hypothetical protein
MSSKQVEKAQYRKISRKKNTNVLRLVSQAPPPAVAAVAAAVSLPLLLLPLLLLPLVLFLLMVVVCAGVLLSSSVSLCT